MIRAGTLLDHLGSAIDAARQQAAPVVAKTDICPDCDGDGQIVLTRLFGRYVEAPYRRTTCTACSGTGEVAADAVVHCAQPGCGAPCWADRACTHGADSPLCGDHANPRCPDCIDEAGGLDR